MLKFMEERFSAGHQLGISCGVIHKCTFIDLLIDRSPFLRSSDYIQYFDTKCRWVLSRHISSTLVFDPKSSLY